MAILVGVRPSCNVCPPPTYVSKWCHTLIKICLLVGYLMTISITIAVVTPS